MKKKIAGLALVLLPLATYAKDPEVPEPPVELDEHRVAKTKTGGNVLLAGGTIHPASGPKRVADILVTGGKIAAIGKGLTAPEGTVTIDCKGRHLTPGAVDCHSHIAIAGGVNEMSEKLSSEVRIEDSIDPKDPTIWRALAGGTTTAHLLHGSANPIGGQDAIIKLRWKKKAKEMLLAGAPRGIKFALGENPTRQEAFPRTRMGMEATYRRAFTEGRVYAKEWKDYEAARARGEDPAPPRKDLRLEAIAGVLDGSIKVHCHCYRADEIVAFLRVCEEFGVKVATLQHVLEGYKVAPEIARHGAGASTFSDWWAYKIEAFDAIPHNAALMTRAGIVTSINSDSHELIRHLFLEAAKSVRYGGLDEVEALAQVTLNPAKQLGIDKWTGSLEEGKDADIVVWNGHPLSTYSHPIATLVDGEVMFELPEKARPTTGPEGLPDPATFAVLPDPGPGFPAPPQSDTGTWAVVGARVEPVSAPAMDGATVLIRGGRIAAIGRDVAIPEDATVIRGQNLVVTPGFIAAGTQLGLVEIESLKVTRDERDSGEAQPDLVALAAVHPASEHLPVTRCAGITTTLVLPTGGLVPGQASVIKLDGWTAAEMNVVERAGLVVEFPDRPAAAPSEDPDHPPVSRRERAGGPRPSRHERLEQLEKWLTRTRAEIERRERAKGTPFAVLVPDLRAEAAAPYLRGERPIFFHANNARTILDVLAFSETHKLRPIIVGGKEAWKVANVLAAKDVAVLYGPVLDTVAREYDPWDSPYRAASVLARAGVRFAIKPDTFGQAGPRNLAFEAATAASFGLGRERALEAITRAPAQILGIPDRGTLEKGKVADLVVAQGDPLEVTSRVRYVFIDGKPVSLESRQTRLEAKARERLEEIKRKSNGNGR